MLFEKRDTFHVSQSPPGWVVKGYGNETFTGEYMTPEVSLSVTAVLAAFTILSEDISSLPLILYRRLKRGKERATDNPLYSFFHDAPNKEHTSMIFRELQIGHLLGWGNSYSQLMWDKRGQVVEAWPLDPSRMQVARKGGQRVYLYQQKTGQPRAFTQDEIWHVPAFGFDGFQGYSRITLSRNAIGLASATEKFGSRFFKNDARPSLALKYPGALKTQAARDNILKSWEDIYMGVDNSHKTALLEEGLDIKEIGIPPADAQYLELRKFQVSEIARVFRIPPHMIGDITNSTSWGSGIEQQEIGYLTHTLRPWMTRIEQSIWQQVLLESERKEYFVEHLADAMLRGDSTARYSMYVQAIQNGIMSANEVREKENMNPYADGDTYLRPLNMTSASAQPTPVATTPARSGLEPLYRDAILRIVRREMNDLRGAAQRFLVKNQPEKFQEWLQTFYFDDHPAFFERQMTPIFDAETRLLGHERPGFLSEFAGIYCENRSTQAESALVDGHPAEFLLKAIEKWQTELPEQLFAALYVEVPAAPMARAQSAPSPTDALLEAIRSIKTQPVVIESGGNGGSSEILQALKQFMEASTRNLMQAIDFLSEQRADLVIPAPLVTVNVQPTPVTVQAENTVNVKPVQVIIEKEPPRTAYIERNRQGEIESITTE